MYPSGPIFFRFLDTPLVVIVVVVVLVAKAIVAVGD